MINTVFPTSRRYYWHAGLVCFLASLFYLYDFVLQVAPSVITNDLMRDLNIGASALGVMSAFFFYGYAPVQLLAGLSYDKFSARYLLCIATLVCALGGLFFSLAHSVLFLCLGRFLTGAGAAFSFIGTLVLLTRWFPAQYFAVLAGVVQFMCCLGSILGQAPLTAAVQASGWRHSIFVIACIGFGLAALLALIVRDHPTHTHQAVHNAPTPSMRKNLFAVAKRPQTWAIGIYATITWVPVVVFAELWGVPYLMKVYHYSTFTVSSLFVWFWLGMGVGSPLIGFISDRMGSRKPLLSAMMILDFLTICILLYYPHLSYFGLLVCLTLFGAAASSQTLSFAVVQDDNSKETVGTAIGLNNMFVVVSGAIFQPFASFILSWIWDGQKLQGAPVFTILDYQLAMSVVPLTFILGWCIVRFWLKESFRINPPIVV